MKVTSLDEIKRQSRRAEYEQRREKERFFHFGMKRDQDSAYIAYLESEMAKGRTMREVMRDLIDTQGVIKCNP